MIRLASMPGGGRDGRLVVVSADRSRYLVPAGVPTLQTALEQWELVIPSLTHCAKALSEGDGNPLDEAALLAPLPRGFQYCEGSTYLSHMERGRAARNAALPPGHGKDAAVFQGASDRFLAPTEPIPLADVTWDLDFEATVGVIVGDVPEGVLARNATNFVRLVLLANDLTLRALLPQEFAKGLGFVQAKPLRAFAPLAVTPEALGDAWDGSLLHATVRVEFNGEPFGSLRSGQDAAFDFGDVIAYAARTRPLAAGTIVTTGTVSNRDERAGFGCLIEKRSVQILAGKQPSPYLQPGDSVRIEAIDDTRGNSLFGAMDARVVERAPQPICRRTDRHA